uniref:Uncharacterized protein n=1 Tax=Anopheles arabiensis TaxID=7173 RepID=A0A182HQ18_ANOAR
MQVRHCKPDCSSMRISEFFCAASTYATIFRTSYRTYQSCSPMLIGFWNGLWTT